VSPCEQYSLEEMARTKMKKIKKFLYTALLLNEIYHPIKFKDHSFYTLGEMAWTKIKYKN
jgi:hypothetical protein